MEQSKWHFGRIERVPIDMLLWLVQTKNKTPDSASVIPMQIQQHDDDGGAISMTCHSEFAGCRRRWHSQINLSVICDFLSYKLGAQVESKSFRNLTQGQTIFVVWICKYL